MVGADVVSTDHERPAGVAERFQRSEDRVCAPSSEISAVLKSEPTRSDFSDDANGFKEETGALAFDALTLGVGAGDVLAGRASDDDAGKSSKVCEQAGRRERADIVIDGDPRIVLGIERAPPVDRLARGHSLEARTMHAERPAAGSSAEKVKDGQRHPAHDPRASREGRGDGTVGEQAPPAIPRTSARVRAPFCTVVRVRCGFAGRKWWATQGSNL